MPNLSVGQTDRSGCEGRFIAEARIRIDATSIEDATRMFENAMQLAQDVPGIHYTTAIVMEDTDA